MVTQNAGRPPSIVSAIPSGVFQVLLELLYKLLKHYFSKGLTLYRQVWQVAECSVWLQLQSHFLLQREHFKVGVCFIIRSPAYLKIGEVIKGIFCK
jgi:hypothetical protein